MRRFFAVWGPPLVGCALASVFVSAAVACILGQHWILLVPSTVGGLASVFGTLGDIGGIPVSGPALRERALDAHCSMCDFKNQRIDHLIKELGRANDALAITDGKRAP